MMGMRLGIGMQILSQQSLFEWKTREILFSDLKRILIAGCVTLGNLARVFGEKFRILF